MRGFTAKSFLQPIKSGRSIDLWDSSSMKMCC